MQIKAENEAAAKKKMNTPPQVAPQAATQAKSSGKAPRVSFLLSGLYVLPWESRLQSLPQIALLATGAEAKSTNKAY